jgi:uncharacterized damage-inducible protein DinB
MSSLLDRLIRHNLHATRTLLEACRPLTAEQFSRAFDIGPGSLHATILHVIGAMQRWADRIGGRTLRPSPEADRRPRTIDELLRDLDAASSDLAAVCREVEREGRLDEVFVVTFRHDGGEHSFTVSRGGAIVHVYTHGVHHRAQCLNMLRRLGVDAKKLPDLDAIGSELAETPAR